MISSFAWLKETAYLTKLCSSTAFLILFPQALQTLSDKFVLRTNLNPMDSHASARIKSNQIKAFLPAWWFEYIFKWYVLSSNRHQTSVA
jgi:hypothetical protein